ncbi:SRPBCC family protein [Sinomonas sp. ASV486]|uniref:SRPBCC family protein n=1 Tax=Sinomonas sp. ASV486 TaxID=3051170 RepID=UPI0027DC153C|nr:SRPBCC family protein [Sinomonas sp. ASV486]MDQ4488785.1 SRPBCC family protein [Sinomonas sp. ASV486]
MAQSLVRSVTINAPVEKVFAFLSDPTDWMLAFPSESEVTDLDIKPGGVGTSAKWTAKIFGVNMSVTHEYREVIPNQRIVSKASAGPVVTFALEPVEGGTALTVDEDIDVQTPLVRVPLHALLVKWTEGDIEAMVANVKSLVETGQKAVTAADEKPRGTHLLAASDEISIAAPVERVFELVKDPSVWLGEDVEISNHTVTPAGVGTTFTASWKVLGIPLKTTHEYTEYVPDEHFTSKSSFGPEFRISVAPEGSGTKLTYAYEVLPSNWADAAVDSLVMKMSERSQTELLEKIKATAEAGASQS